MSQLESDSSRPSKFDSVTMNISTELAIAQFAADSLQKIRHICEAFLFLSRENQKTIMAEEKDRDELKKIYDLVLSFLETYEQAMIPDTYQRRFSIPWRFAKPRSHEYFRIFNDQFMYSEDNEDPKTHYRYEKYGRLIEESVKEAEKTAKNYELYYRGLTEGDQKYWKIYHEFLYQVTRNGEAPGECKEMKIRFVSHVMPRILDLSRKILMTFISGETWEETLILMRGGKTKDASQPASD